MTATLELDWLARAGCVGLDPALFHPERGDPADEAKAVCASCPVRAECLHYALSTGQKFGIWGGLSERGRRRLVEDRPDLGVRDTKTCPCCGDRFVPRMRHQRFCSVDCRNYHRTTWGRL